MESSEGVGLQKTEGLRLRLCLLLTLQIKLLSVFSCEKQDLQYLIHESVWHIVCIHSFIYFTKIPDICYVPGTGLDTGDTGEQIAVVLVLMGLTFYWRNKNIG